MTATDVATWVGTAIAFISMGVSIIQAKRAKSAAAKAEEMRDEISIRNANSELSGLEGMIAAATRAMDKYGPGAGAVARHGYSPENDAAAVRALTGCMSLLQGLLLDNFDVNVRDVTTNLNSLLIRFADAPNDMVRDKIGCDIYSEIVEFGGNIRRLVNANIYRQH